MFVSDWMTRKVLTLSPEDGISDAIGLIREKGIKHIPVVKDERLKGILSDRDIKDFSPSRATTLDVYELHYVLARTKVKEIMKTRVFTTTSDTPIEEAALTMFDQKIGCLPVVGNGQLSGIISDRDIFRALVDITGVRHGGHRICVTIEDRPGSIKEVADIVRTNGFSLQSILTSYEKMPEGYRKIVIRTKGEGRFGGLKAGLVGRYRGVLIKKA
jgi:acetoin utilization protein AcuB